MMKNGYGLFLLVGSLAFAGACSQGTAQLSPSGPSAASMTPGAGVTGWSTSSGSADLNASMNAVGASKKVAGAGTVAALTGSCEDDTLAMVVHGVRVVTDADTEFFISAETPIEGGCGNLRPGTKVVVEADADPNADGSFTANTITIIDQPGGKPPSPVEGDGTIAALKGTCPALTMVIHGYPVMTISTTTFTAGALTGEEACQALRPGTKVHVEGVLAGNSVVADTMEVLSEEQ